MRWLSASLFKSETRLRAVRRGDARARTRAFDPRTRLCTENSSLCEPLYTHSVAGGPSSLGTSVSAEQKPKVPKVSRQKKKERVLRRPSAKVQGRLIEHRASHPYLASLVGLHSRGLVLVDGAAWLHRRGKRDQI